MSAWADNALREEIAAGRRPRAEFFELERRHDLDLLDWSRLGKFRQRSKLLALRHAAAALTRLRDYDLVFSDGEHVGIPLALAMSFGQDRPHVVIGHHLTTPPKRPFFRLLGVHRHMTRIIVHSQKQLEGAVSALGIPRDQLEFIPYGVDTCFWQPGERPEEGVIVAAGREHRDYALLDRACDGLGQQVLIAAGSLHSPGARCTMPSAASRAVVRQLNHVSLREWYDRASIVAIPLLQNDFQAGVTTLLEAMAMGKAVVVSATEGQRDVVVEGETGLLVTPGDEKSLRDAITRLLQDPSERKRLGRNARSAAMEQFSLDRYVHALAASLRTAAA